MQIMKNQKTNLLTKFLKNRQGTSAIEFALIAPVMIFTYFGAVEVSRYYIEKNKLETMSETIADLITQGETISISELDDIFSIASKSVSQQQADRVNIVITAVRTLPDENGTPITQVTWSRSKTGASTLSKGAIFTDLPTGLANNYETIIITDLKFQYSAIHEYFIKGPKSFDRRFIKKPRYSSDIPCDDC